MRMSDVTLGNVIEISGDGSTWGMVIDCHDTDRLMPVRIDTFTDGKPLTGVVTEIDDTRGLGIREFHLDLDESAWVNLIVGVGGPVTIGEPS